MFIFAKKSIADLRTCIKYFLQIPLILFDINDLPQHTAKMLHNSKNILIQLSLIISSIAFSPIEILAIVKGPDGTYYDEKNPARGYDFEQFGIYYKILLDKDGNGTRTLATVAGPKEYQGEVVIPDEVRYGGHDYKVAMINGF